MNKKIFTTIVIGIILILPILLGGFTLWQYGEIRKEESGLPEIEIPEKGVKEETVNWETYQSSKMGFLVKYPSIFEVFSEVSTPTEPSRPELLYTLFLTHPEEKEVNSPRPTQGMIFYVSSWTSFSSPEMTFEKWTKEALNSLAESLSPQVAEEEHVLGGDNLVQKLSYELPYYYEGKLLGKEVKTMIYVQKNQTMYAIEVVFNKEKQNIYLPILNQMLSTFKFIETSTEDKIFIPVNNFSDATKAITYYLNQYPNEPNILNKLVAQFSEENKKTWKIDDQNIIQWIEQFDLNNDGTKEIIVGYADPFILAGEQPSVYGFPNFFSIFTKEGNLYKKTFGLGNSETYYYGGIDAPSTGDINGDNKLELIVSMPYFNFHTGEKEKETYTIQWNGQEWVVLTP